MSSFPILHLPLLALRDVIDCWNIFETYQFSKVSMKCKEVAKYRFKKPVVYSDFLRGYGCYMCHKFENAGFHGVLNFDPFNIGTCSYYINLFEEYSTARFEPSTDVLEKMDWLLELFNHSLNCFSLNTAKLSNDQIKDFISWMNSMEQELFFNFSLRVLNGEGLKTFLNDFKKPTEKVLIGAWFNDYLQIEGNFGPLGFQCQKLIADYNHWIQNKELFTLDFVKAEFAGYTTSDDLNKFMRKWKEGKSNARMEECHFELENFNLQRFSVDLSLTFETDKGNINKYIFVSKKTKLKLSKLSEGKVQIKRYDGSIATVWFKNNYPVSDSVSIAITVSKP